MKHILKISSLCILLFCSTYLFGQTANDTTSSYVIIQVTSPPTITGVYKVNILYGNGNKELFKEGKFDRSEPYNYAIDAMNMLSKKGYVLISSVNGDWGGIPYIQYIMYKKE